MQLKESTFLCQFIVGFLYVATKTFNASANSCYNFGLTDKVYTKY